MKRFFIPFIIAFALIGLVVLATNNEQENSPSVVKIGYMGPLTGQVAFTGIPTKNAFELGFKEKCNGHCHIEVLYEDDKCDPKEAVTIAKKFLEIDNVDYLVSGVCSANVLAIGPFAEEKKKVLMSSIAASPDISKSGDYTFRVSVSALVSAKATSVNLLNQGINSISIFVEENPYTMGWKDVLQKEFEQNDGRVVAVEKFLSNEKDLKTPLLKLHGSKPQAFVLLALSVPSAFKILDAYQTLGLTETLVGNELFSYRSVIEKYQKVMEGMFVAVYNLDLQAESMKRLMENYQTQYGKPLTEEFLGALSYDTFSVLYDGIQKCGKDSECMKQFLYSMKDYDGVSGTFSIDENGDGVHQFVLKQVKNGILQ